MLKRVRVGLIDSQVRGASALAVVAARRFAVESGDSHGSQVADCVLEHCPSARLLVAQVFDARREATIDSVLEALAWLVCEEVQLINMSFGMRQVSPRLAEACHAAAHAGVVLIASAPARGGATFPAAFDECIAVTGDARCSPGEISRLATATADFGTHSLLDFRDRARGGGASIAAARMSGMVASLLEAGVQSRDLRSELVRRARYFGPERRHA